MGEMADFALDQVMDDIDLFDRYSNDPAMLRELGFMDEKGYVLTPFWGNGTRSAKPNGPGECPVCKGPTHLVNGINGSFYGCNNFPKCKGSRNG